MDKKSKKKLLNKTFNAIGRGAEAINMFEHQDDPRLLQPILSVQEMEQQKDLAKTLPKNAIKMVHVKFEYSP